MASHFKTDADVNILTFTAILCGSTKETEEREESNQLECIQTAEKTEPKDLTALTHILIITGRGVSSEKRRGITVKHAEEGGISFLLL